MKNRQKIVSLILMMSLILSNILPVFASEYEVESFEELDLLEEDIEEIESFLESEIRIGESSEELEDFSIKEDLEDLRRLENYRNIYRSSGNAGFYGLGMAAGYDNIRLETLDRTISIKSKLTSLIDTLDIVELERLKASYGAEADISKDIGKVILKILSLYENVDGITSFQSALKSVKGIIRDLREIKSMIRSIKVKININKLDRNLSLNYVKEVDSYIENKIFDASLKEDARKFFFLRLDSSINKELLKLEMRSERLKISPSKEDLKSLDKRFQELRSIIDYMDKNFQNEFDKNKTYSEYMSRVEKNRSELELSLDFRETLSKEVTEKLEDLSYALEEARRDHLSFKSVDLVELEEKLAVLDYYISNQPLRERKNNYKLYTSLDGDLKNLKRDLSLRSELEELLEKELPRNFDTREYDNFMALISELESKKYLVDIDEIRDLEEYKLAFVNLKKTHEKEVELKTLEAEFEGIKVNKFNYKRKLERLLSIRERVESIDMNHQLLRRVEEKERELKDLPALLDLELAI